MNPSTGPRLLAVKAVTAVLDDKVTLTGFFRAEAGGTHRAEASHLAYGIIRWLIALQWLNSKLLSKPLKARDRDIGILIMGGLFQLWHDGSADHAVVHSTVESARELGKDWATGLINAVLRRFQREKETLLNALAADESRFAHPPWLLSAIRGDWPDAWQTIAEQNNRQAPLWLRVNTTRIDCEAARSQLEAAGFETTLHGAAPGAICITPAVPVSQVPGFADGHFSVQDPAAQLAATLLAPEPGHRVLDACAAPGGKASHLLETVPGIDLLALDRDAERLALVRENLDRLGLDCALLAADAGDPAGWWDSRPFDRILLDAPCSATGVIRRHPEIKHLRDDQQVGKAVEDQRRLLEGLWPLLRPGGILVYATCSVLRVENHEQIHGFLSRHPEAGEIRQGGTDGPGRQILPGEEGMDGFYYAIVRKSD